MNRNQITVKKIKIRLNGGADIIVDVQKSEDDGSGYTEFVTTERPVIIHEDFRNALDKLKPFVAQIFHYKEVLLLESSNLNVDEKKALYLLKKHIDREYTQVIQNITITGIAQSGEGNKVGIIITSTMKTENGQVSAVNTPRIMLSADSYGFENELEENIGVIANEMYSYLYESKKAVPEFGLTEENSSETKEQMAAVG